MRYALCASSETQGRDVGQAGRCATVGIRAGGRVKSKTRLSTTYSPSSSVPVCSRLRSRLIQSLAAAMSSQFRRTFMRNWFAVEVRLCPLCRPLMFTFVAKLPPSRRPPCECSRFYQVVSLCSFGAATLLWASSSSVPAGTSSALPAVPTVRLLCSVSIALSP